MADELRVIRIDGDFRRTLPEDVRWAATLLMAYVDGLADGQRASAAPAPAPSSQEPPGAPDRTGLESRAEAAGAAESQNPSALISSANVCGPISGGPTGTDPVPAPGPTASTSDRDVVVVWGPGAYATIRRSLP